MFINASYWSVLSSELERVQYLSKSRWIFDVYLLLVSVGVGAFVIGLGQISSFLSLNNEYI